jgi:hypothetical protein
MRSSRTIPSLSARTCWVPSSTPPLRSAIVTESLVGVPGERLPRSPAVRVLVRVEVHQREHGVLDSTLAVHSLPDRSDLFVPRLRRPGTSRTRLAAVGEVGHEIEVGEALLGRPRRARFVGTSVGAGPRGSWASAAGGPLVDEPAGWTGRARRRSLRTRRASSSATERLAWIARMRKACQVASSTLTRAVCCSRSLTDVPSVGSPRRRVDGSHEGASLSRDLGSHRSSADGVRSPAVRRGGGQASGQRRRSGVAAPWRRAAGGLGKGVDGDIVVSWSAGFRGAGPVLCARPVRSLVHASLTPGSRPHPVVALDAPAALTKARARPRGHSPRAGREWRVRRRGASSDGVTSQPTRQPSRQPSQPSWQPSRWTCSDAHGPRWKVEGRAGTVR